MYSKIKNFSTMVSSTTISLMEEDGIRKKTQTYSMMEPLTTARLKAEP